MTADIRARLTLVNLTNVGPNRARWLLNSFGGTEDAAAQAVAMLRQGRLPDTGPAPSGVTKKLVGEWRAELLTTDVDELVVKHRTLGIEMLSPHDIRWPFGEDPEPPILLFYMGALELLEEQAALAVVGTRRCTTVGRTVAYRIGQDFAHAGVTVVSGLALGVDGAAHRGALDRNGPAIGVVGSGLDVVYPGGNRALWHEVSGTGLLLSEAPANARPKRWRFPARNRLIASLSAGVVIVESHGAGGSLLTVDEAVDRGKPVFAVPGSVLSPASDGTNGLLVEGAIPVRNARDVLEYLNLPPLEPPPDLPVRDSASPDPAQQTELDLRTTLDVGPPAADLPGLVEVIETETLTGPVHLDRLILASGYSVSEVMATVQALAAAGAIELDGSTVSRPQ